MPSASVCEPGVRHAGHLHVARHVHDLLVHERALRAQAVRAAHVAVVGGEDHDRVVVRAAVLERAAAPCRASRRPSAAASRSSRGGAATTSCRPGRCSPTGRAAGPSATAAARRACRAGRRRSSAAARRTLRRSGRRTTAARRRPSTSRARGSCAARATSSGCARLVVRLVDREPHHVVRVHERDGEEPRLVERRRVGAQPRRRVRRDDRVEVHAGAGPTHEVAVVALPVGEAVLRSCRASATASSATCRCSSSGSPRRAGSNRSSGSRGRAPCARA